jgi:hypothetical protein
MQVFNRYGPMLLVLGYVNERSGDPRSVMPDCSEEVNGPPFLRDELGRVVSYYTIPGQLIVAAAGRTDLNKGIIIMPNTWQIVHSWRGADSCSYKVVIQDYRLLERQRRSLS